MMRGAPSAGRTTAAIPHAPPPTAAGARKTCGSSFLPGRRGPLRRARPASPPPAPRAAPRPAATAVPARPHAAPLRGGSPATGAGLRPGRLGRPLGVGPPRRSGVGTSPLRRPARSHPTTTPTLPPPAATSPPAPRLRFRRPTAATATGDARDPRRRRRRALGAHKPPPPPLPRLLLRVPPPRPWLSRASTAA